ncbi:hypothetical protein LY56_02238 [Roseinatronobacter thiooxidans]|uniref:Uncharacterized protein n=1 Tax=Roseinatronobacter thiooxidans TaxID=121821 RepID=A0A2W7QCY7_9RHOB|nr:hypothetical protein [Roseinatronobacter thiooxidans]PZX41947.1 hypothetical protein LY56_02238 [Roseinatronobacter thiooxidans]
MRRAAIGMGQGQWPAQHKGGPEPMGCAEYGQTSSYDTPSIWVPEPMNRAKYEQAGAHGPCDMLTGQRPCAALL